jgi:limonene-1,2-epoxide hydrolase
MDNIDIFKHFATAFESAVQDDDWSGLKKYLAKDATYINVGGPDPKSEGRDEVISFLKKDVANTDKRFDTRTLMAIT